MKKAAKLTSAFLSLLLGASPLLTTTIPAVANEARAGQDDALTGEVIDVTEYGADPSGYKDSSPAIIEAIAAAKEKTDAGESVTLSFPKGEYNFYPDKATNNCSTCPTQPVRIPAHRSAPSESVLKTCRTLPSTATVPVLFTTAR